MPQKQLKIALFGVQNLNGLIIGQRVVNHGDSGAGGEVAVVFYQSDTQAMVEKGKVNKVRWELSHRRLP